MTIQQLQYALEVSHTGSISQAAKNLFVSHTCVSTAIRALEAELGFSVFFRGWNGVVPTAQGKKVLDYAAQICDCHQHILDIGASQKQSVRIIASYYQLFSDLFVQLVAQSESRNHDLFSIESHQNFEDSLQKLSNFETDLYVIATSQTKTVQRLKRIDSMGLRVHHAVRVPMVAHIGQGHRLYHKADLSAADLKDGVIVDTKLKLTVNTKSAQKRIGFDPERAVLVHSQITQYDLVRRGFGFCIGPQWPDATERQYGFRSVPIPDLYYTILSVTHPAGSMKPEVQRYLRLLDEALDTVRTDKPEESLRAGGR